MLLIVHCICQACCPELPVTWVLRIRFKLFVMCDGGDTVGVAECTPLRIAFGCHAQFCAGLCIIGVRRRNTAHMTTACPCDARRSCRRGKSVWNAIYQLFFFLLSFYFMREKKNKKVVVTITENRDGGVCTTPSFRGVQPYFRGL